MIELDGICFLFHEYTIGAAAGLAKIRARKGIYDGRNPIGLVGKRYLHVPTGTVLCYSRDSGMHSSGWWKNPEYERCRHLSLSFREPGVINGRTMDRDAALTKKWLGEFFGDDRTKLWCEPPYSDTGHRLNVWHYRLFCAPDWSPIVPRGEVYSKEYTELGWKSFSDVQAELEQAELQRAGGAA